MSIIIDKLLLRNVPESSRFTITLQPSNQTYHIRGTGFQTQHQTIDVSRQKVNQLRITNENDNHSFVGLVIIPMLSSTMLPSLSVNKVKKHYIYQFEASKIVENFIFEDKNFIVPFFIVLAILFFIVFGWYMNKRAANQVYDFNV